MSNAPACLSAGFPGYPLSMDPFQDAVVEAEKIDEQVARWAAMRVDPRHVPWLRRLTHLGGTEVAFLAGAAAGLISRVTEGSWRPAGRLVLVIGGQNLLHNAIKRMTERARPSGPHHSFFKGASFPSGHTATAAATWPEIASAMAPGSRIARAAAVTAGPAVGATRVLLGVHWLTDVIAGLGLGWGWLWLVRKSFGWTQER